MESFITFIFVSIFVIWLLGLVGRWLLRYWLQKKQRQFAEQFGGAQQQQTRGNRRQNRREGEVSVQQTVRVEKKVNKEVGDYVEFEEVEITEETKVEE